MHSVAHATNSPFGDTAQRTRLFVPMRDGIALATDVYWPVGADLETQAPLPVLLERSPYDVRAPRGSDGRHADGRGATPESGAAFFVDRGFVVVRQDCRGRAGSGGIFSKYVGEADDGFDTHAWLAAQPWCDGRIITHGVSYGAHTQTAAASVRASNIAAMVLDSGGFSNAWEAGARFGGAFELKQVVWAYRRALKGQSAEGDSTQKQALEAADLHAWFAAMPWRKGFSLLSSAPEYEDFVFEQWSHEDLDDFWKRPGLYARGYYDNFPPVPVMTLSSWYDPYVLTAVENFQALHAKNHQACLVMGPWTHGARSVTYAGDVDFGAASTLDGNLASDYLNFKADWFDSVLSAASAPRPSVTYFLMGGGSGRRDVSGRMHHGGEWRHADLWPPREATSLDLFLTTAQGLSSGVPEEPASITFDADPRNPVPSMGGGITSGEPLMRGGAFDQRHSSGGVGTLPLSARQDVVSFVTDPLSAALEVVGEILVEVGFSSSAPDTDLTAKLIDVYPPNPDYPDGFAMNITDGMLRCRYRNHPSSPELMIPGQIYQLSVRLPDTANLFATGHRIRLDISSSNFPRCDVNPNTGRPVMGDRTSQTARNTIHLGTSRLRLTTLPR